MSTDKISPEEINVARLGQLAGRPRPRDLERATILEIKYDGHRIYMYRGEDGVRTFARSGNEKTGLLRTIEELVLQFPVGTWLDGEACAFNSNGTNDWGSAQAVLGAGKHRPELEQRMTFVVFDMIAYDGHDMRRLPLKNRREILEAAFDTLGIESDRLLVSPQFENTPDAYTALIEAGFEGAIVKDPESLYSSGGRGDGWFKMKATETIEAVVIGIKPGQGRFTGMLGALIFGQYDSTGELIELGRCSGMNDKVRREMSDLHEQGKLVGTVIELAHMGVMPSGGLRHPQYKRTRTDKDPKTVTLIDQANSL